MRLPLLLIILFLCCSPLYAANTLHELALADGEGTVLLIRADSPLTFSSYWLSQPTRLVIEFAQTRHGRDLHMPATNGRLITKMLLESPPELAGGTRLTLILAARLDAQFATDGNSVRLTLRPFGGQPAPQDAYARAAAREAELKRLALAEEATKLEAEHRRAEEAERRRQVEEKAHLEAARLEEARRVAEEAKARDVAEAEKARVAAIEAARSEELRRAAEEAKAQEAAQAEAARRRQEDQVRAEAAALAANQRAEAEKARLAAEAAEKAKAEAAAKLAEAERTRVEEARRIAAAENAKAEAAAREAAHRAEEEKARLASEAERQARESERVRSLHVTKLSNLATLQRLGFQGQSARCLVWAEFSQPVDVASEWPDEHTLLVTFSPARIANRINTYPLDTKAFGSLVTYIQPDFDPAEKRVTFRLRLTGRTPLAVQKNGGRIELRLGAWDEP